MDVGVGPTLLPPGVNADVGCDDLGSVECADISVDCVGDSSARTISRVKNAVPVEGQQLSAAAVAAMVATAANILQRVSLPP